MRVDLSPITSKRVIVAADRDGDCRKLCQLMFLSDGSLTVSFPYFHEPNCQLAIVTAPAAAHVPRLKIDKNRWASSHRVKYTHHVDGRAHFSQDGRIRTVVKRQAVPLTESVGHLFTLIVQGLSAFKSLPAEQRHAPNDRRANVGFSLKGKKIDTLKIVGRIFKRDFLISTLVNPKPPVGPVINLVDDEGRRTQTAIISVASAPERILAVSAQPWHQQNEGRPSITFIGGFDPPDIADDYSRTMDFLFMASPAGDMDSLLEEIDTVDFARDPAR